VQVVGGLSFATISAGIGYTCALTTGGAAYCWGYNASGQLGDGTTTERDSPVAVLGSMTFVSVSTGGDAAGNGHACGLTASGAAYCWGANETGQLGIGTYGYSSSSTPVPVAGGLTFAAVAAGSNFNGFAGQAHTCGVTIAGAAYCWGDNAHGQLGVGTTTGPETCVISDPCSTMPVAVLGGLNFSP
jgi:alpha-tubulin suppressor-like RCC1 family protein